MPSTQSQITSSFPGVGYPVGSRVCFRKGGDDLLGTVVALRLRHAEVLTDGGERYTVPYSACTSVGNTTAPAVSLEQVETLANGLIDQHQAGGRLAKAWRFGFDLAPSRAGACNYSARRINLSVSYCQRATRAEIEDTILHEIAHAIVGPRHNHDKVWKAKALEIGCAGERCHRVEHSTPRWVGECGCGQRWFRHRLQRRLMQDRVCAKCRGVIIWRSNTTPAD